MIANEVVDAVAGEQIYKADAKESKWLPGPLDWKT